MSDPRPWRVIYDRFAPFVALLCLLIAVVAAAGTYVNDRNQTAERQDRVRENSRLLACFDKFATELAGGLPPVRVASEARDKAVTGKDVGVAQVMRALDNLLNKAIEGTAKPADSDRLVKALEDYKAAFKRLREANQNLDDVREANPYPPPPSEFCHPD